MLKRLYIEDKHFLEETFRAAYLASRYRIFTETNDKYNIYQGDEEFRLFFYRTYFEELFNKNMRKITQDNNLPVISSMNIDIENQMLIYEVADE